MRPDMKDVIIDVYRRGRGYSRTSDHFRTYLKNTDPENLPRFLSNRFVRDSSPNDNLAPLRKFFEANVGRPWNDVYSEIRAHCDTRTIRGQHLWEHVIREIHESTPPYVYNGVASINYGAYVDDDGILQYRHHPKYSRPKSVPTKIGSDYTDYREGCSEWFEFILPELEYPKRKKGWIPPAGQWYRMNKYTETFHVWETRWNGYERVPVRLVPTTRSYTTKKQVGKNCLKKIRSYLIRKALESL